MDCCKITGKNKNVFENKMEKFFLFLENIAKKNV